MTFLVTIHDEQQLLFVLEVEAVENRRVVGRENDLLVIIIRKCSELL